MGASVTGSYPSGFIPYAKFEGATDGTYNLGMYPQVIETTDRVFCAGTWGGAKITFMISPNRGLNWFPYTLEDGTEMSFTADQNLPIYGVMQLTFGLKVESSSASTDLEVWII